MPNLLAHFGTHGLASRALLGPGALPWILVGCTIPDVPWILHRALRAAELGISPYDARLYAIVQSSLLLSWILAGALALLAARPGRVFAVLSANALLHLVLDALQTKVGNGVHLLAPLSWDLLNFGLFWPESATTVLLTALGLVASAWMLLRCGADRVLETTRTRVGLAAAAAALYLVLPLVLLPAAEAADVHSVHTLRARDARPQRDVAFDRVRFSSDADGGWVTTWAGERIRVEGVEEQSAGTLSLRGRFVSEVRVRVSEYHVHWPWLRDAASYAGLIVLAACWAPALLRLQRGARAGARHETRGDRGRRAGGDR